MARKPRIHVPGGLYHVILRGNGGQPVFITEADRYRFYLLLQEGICRFGYRIHAFCLMTNHIHLALQAGDLPLSRGLQNLSFRDVGKHVNRDVGSISSSVRRLSYRMQDDAELADRLRMLKDSFEETT